MTSSETFFVVFAASESAPQWLSKRQDISVSLTNFWCLVSTDGGKKQETKEPPHAIEGVSGLGGRTRTQRAPDGPAAPRGSSGSALPAAPGFRGFCWPWWPLTQGKQPHKRDVIFSGALAAQFLLLQSLKIPPVDVVPLRGHLPGGSHCAGGGQAGSPSQRELLNICRQRLHSSYAQTYCFHKCYQLRKLMSRNFSYTGVASLFICCCLHTRPQPAKSYFWLTHGFGGD